MEIIEDFSGIRKAELKIFIEDILSRLPDAEKVLIIFPDYTRIDFTDKIAPYILKRYHNSSIDFLNAGGTHRAMADSEFKKKLGIDKDGSGVRFLNHNFSNPINLKTVGKIPKEMVSEKTGGQLNSDIEITVNRIVFSNYDLVVAVSGTVPHEAAGYSGGLKIFFPGISGPDVIDLFHWAAVLVGIPKIIGEIENNARDIINAGAKAVFEKIDAPVYSFNMVNTEEGENVFPIGLYVDSDYEGFVATYKKAAAASSKVHVKYIDEPLSQIVQVIPEHYDEIWLAGKGSYKLQRPGVLAEGAEVIIYAPHICCFHTNRELEADLFKLGYHCRDRICSLIEEGENISRNAAAHLINVSGPGIYDHATESESLHFKVTLATAIPEETCRRIGLSYRDPSAIKESDFKGPGKLWIDEGGKYLYDLNERKDI